MVREKVPAHTDLVQPTLTALRELGGIAGTFMIDEAVIENLNLPREVRELPHVVSGAAKKAPRSEIGYRLAWVRTALKKYGLLDNPERGLWQLTPLGKRTESVDGRKVIRQHRKRRDKNDPKV